MCKHVFVIIVILTFPCFSSRSRFFSFFSFFIVKVKGEQRKKAKRSMAATVKKVNTNKMQRGAIIKKKAQKYKKGLRKVKVCQLSCAFV